MNNSYLWNKTGRRDPFIDALESRLASKRPVKKSRMHTVWWLAPLVASAALVIFVLMREVGRSEAPPAEPVQRLPSKIDVVRTRAVPIEATRTAAAPGVFPVDSVDTVDCGETESDLTDGATTDMPGQR